MKMRKSPYKCHIFVCTKSRGGERKSCGDADAAGIKAALKQAIGDRGWKGSVRVSDSGCLGLCEMGPNILLYPQQIWFSGVGPDHVAAILERVEELITE